MYRFSRLKEIRISSYCRVPSHRLADALLDVDASSN
jgi:hypothetical protein